MPHLRHKAGVDLDTFCNQQQEEDFHFALIQLFACFLDTLSDSIRMP